MNDRKAKSSLTVLLQSSLALVGPTSVFVLINIMVLSLALMLLGTGVWAGIRVAHRVHLRMHPAVWGVPVVLLLGLVYFVILQYRYRLQLPHLVAMDGLVRGLPEARRHPLGFGWTQVRRRVPSMREFFHLDGWLRSRICSGLQTHDQNASGEIPKREWRSWLPTPAGTRFWVNVAWVRLMQGQDRVTRADLLDAVRHARRQRHRHRLLGYLQQVLGWFLLLPGMIPLLGMGWLLSLPAAATLLLAVGGGGWITILVAGPMRLALAVVTAQRIETGPIRAA